MKIGIVTSAYELPRIQTLLRYLEGKAEVRLYVEEHTLVNPRTIAFDEHVLFTKGKGYVLLTLARIAEAAGVPVVNSARSTWISTHRFVASIVCQRAGVPVPEFGFGVSAPDAFGRFIVKNIVDQSHLRFLDILPIVGEPGMEIPPITTAEEAGAPEQVKRHHFFQRYLRSEFEYKVYGFSERLLYYRQVPVLVNPDKMSTRVPIDEIPELERAARLAMCATGLTFASMDFLEEDGRFQLTDINPIPNFNYVPDGARIVGDHLLARAREKGPSDRGRRPTAVHRQE